MSLFKHAWCHGKALAAAFAVARASISMASPIVDVDNLVIIPPNFSLGFFAGKAISSAQPISLQQSFTAGADARLASIDLYGYAGQGGAPQGTTTLSLFSGVADPANILGSVSRLNYAIGTTAGIVSFDFSPQNILISAGQKLIFEVSLANGCRGALCTIFVDIYESTVSPLSSSGYAGGSLTLTQGGKSFPRPNNDLNFRTTVTPVPEPSSWATAVLGFAAGGIALRRRRRHTRVYCSIG